MRIRVSVPDVLGEDTLWAEACTAPGARSVPETGQSVWIMFEGGKVDRPVWFGVVPGPER